MALHLVTLWMWHSWFVSSNKYSVIFWNSSINQNLLWDFSFEMMQNFLMAYERQHNKDRKIVKRYLELANRIRIWGAGRVLSPRFYIPKQLVFCQNYVSCAFLYFIGSVFMGSEHSVDGKFKKSFQFHTRNFITVDYRIILFSEP